MANAPSLLSVTVTFLTVTSDVDIVDLHVRGSFGTTNRSSCFRCVWVVFSNRTNFVSACGSASESGDLLTLLCGGSGGIEKLPKKLHMRFIAIHRLHWSLKAVRKPIPHNFTRSRDVAALDVVTIDVFRSLWRLLNGMRFYYDSSLL